MITGNDVRRLIDLAFDYVSAETEQQANQAHDQAAMLATETTTLKMWLDLIEYIKTWNSSNEHNDSHLFITMPSDTHLSTPILTFPLHQGVLWSQIL